MPVGEFPGDSSWGYNPVFYMAPKSVYGRPDEFRALIDAAHQRGIAVILDLVFNHAWGDDPYYRMYPPLFTPDGHELLHLNPFFHRRLLALRRAHPALRSDNIEFYMDDFARFKVLRYKRWSENGDVVVVALNFDGVPQPVGLGLPSNGDWEDTISGQRVRVTTNWHDFVLPAWTSLVLTSLA
jgi:pullulanase/glycogen debranching enzyme